MKTNKNRIMALTMIITGTVILIGIMLFFTSRSDKVDPKETPPDKPKAEQTVNDKEKEEKKESPPTSKEDVTQQEKEDTSQKSNSKASMNDEKKTESVTKQAQASKEGSAQEVKKDTSQKSNNKPSANDEKQTPAPTPTQEPETQPKKASGRRYDLANDLYAAFNAYRTQNGLNALTQTSAKQEEAMQIAERLVNNFNHTTGHVGGEVIGKTNVEATGSYMLQSFKNSPGHNATLLSDGGLEPLSITGVGVYYDSASQFYYYCIITF